MLVNSFGAEKMVGVPYWPVITRVRPSGPLSPNSSWNCLGPSAVSTSAVSWFAPILMPMASIAGLPSATHPMADSTPIR